MSNPKKVIVAEVVFQNEEGVEIFRLFAEGFNDCHLDKEAARRLIARGDEFKSGIKRLTTSLSVPSGSSLKS